MFALHDESPIVLYSMSLNEGSKLSGLHVLITQYITSKCKIIDVIAIFKKFWYLYGDFVFSKITCKILRRNRGEILLHRELKIVYPCHFLFWVLNEIGLLISFLRQLTDADAVVFSTFGSTRWLSSREDCKLTRVNIKRALGKDLIRKSVWTVNVIETFILSFNIFGLI